MLTTFWHVGQFFYCIFYYPRLLLQGCQAGFGPGFLLILPQPAGIRPWIWHALFDGCSEMDRTAAQSPFPVQPMRRNDYPLTRHKMRSTIIFLISSLARSYADNGLLGNLSSPSSKRKVSPLALKLAHPHAPAWPADQSWQMCA